jgi:hypothetical protein
LLLERNVGKARVGVATILAVAALIAPIATPPALAAPEFQVVADTTYQIRTAERLVHVVVDARAASYKPDSGGRQYYYDSVNLVLMGGATTFAASANGAQAAVRIIESAADHVVVAVSLNRNVFYRESTTFHLEFNLPNGSGNGDVRVGTTVAAFPVWGIGTPDTPGGSVTITVPPNFALDVQGEALPEPTGAIGSGRHYRWASISDPSAFTLFATADLTILDPSLFTETDTNAEVEGSEVRITVRAWRDDSAWGQRISKRITEALPVLGDLIGIEYFGTRHLIVIETVSRSIDGYAGIFDKSQATDEIQIAYDVDEGVTYHEAAHAWFNFALSDDRWVLEGFASYYGELAAHELNAEPPSTELTADLKAAAFPLANWGDPGIEDLDAELYAYAASLQAARELGERAGLDGLTVAWATMVANQSAYQPMGGGLPEVGSHPADWRYLLDVLEERTDKTYGDMLEEWVISSAQLPLLDERSTARAAYAGLLDDTGDWPVPVTARRQMNAWAFDDAEVSIASAEEVLATRDELLSRGAALRLTPNLDAVRTQYLLGDFSLASEEAGDVDAAIDAYEAADAANDGTDLIEMIGLIGSDPSAALAASATAVEKGRTGDAVMQADAASAAWHGAGTAGAIRLGVGGGVVLVGGSTALLLVRRRRR